jgi:hypothetical protein
MYIEQSKQTQSPHISSFFPAYCIIIYQHISTCAKMLPTSGIATTMPTSGAALATPVTVPVTTTGVAAGLGEDRVEILMLKIGEFHFQTG